MVTTNIAHDIMKCEGGCTKWRRLSMFPGQNHGELLMFAAKKRSFKVDTLKIQNLA